MYKVCSEGDDHVSSRDSRVIEEWLLSIRTICTSKGFYTCNRPRCTLFVKKDNE